MKSSSRNGRRQRLLAVHTTEGILTAAGLRSFFDRPDAGGSSHAAADAAGTLATPEHGFVSYSAAAWTLRSGNPISDNIELCGFARWTREDWLARRDLLLACARWLAARHLATGIPLVKLTPAQVRAGASGVIAHHDWTVGMNDGSHWDVGVSFPWDLVLPDAQAIADGRTPTAIYPTTTTPEETEVPVYEFVFIAGGADQPWWKYDGWEREYVGPGYPQLLADLNRAEGPPRVKLIHPNTLASIPVRNADQVDEQAIADAVAARLAAMTPTQLQAELSAVIPTRDYLGTVPTTNVRELLRGAPDERQPVPVVTAAEERATVQAPAE